MGFTSISDRLTQPNPPCHFSMENRIGAVAIDVKMSFLPEKETVLMPPSSDPSADDRLSRDALLILDLPNQHVSVDCENPSVTLGRHANNRIVIDHPKVSRIHARIELRKDEFVLTDQSTNGTHVHPNGGDAVVLRKTKWTMKGDGIIYLGRTATPDSPNAIHFHIL
jgi:adenylate cyclase